MKAALDLSLYVDDPIFRPETAAKYLDCSPRTLRDLGLKRDPLPGTAGTRWGYRRSTLNAHLAELARTRGAYDTGTVPGSADDTKSVSSL